MMNNQFRISSGNVIIAALLSAYSLAGCGGGGSSSGGIDESGDDGVLPAGAKGWELWCKYNGVTITYLCVEETSCTAASAAGYCSMYYSGDLDHADLWSESVLMGPCNDGDGPLNDFPQTPCICEYGSPAQNDVICDVPPGLDEFDYPDGYPIPGEGPSEPTGGEDPTESTGGEGSVKSYVCGDPLIVQDKCVYYNHVVDPLLDADKMCWVDNNQPNDYTVCITAASDAEALSACTTKCTEFLTHAAGEIAAHVPSDQIVSPSIDCMLDGVIDSMSVAGEVPREKTASDFCDPQVNYLVAWGGTSVLRPFVASLTLSTTSGGSASNGGIAGYMAYETSNCTSTQCDLTIDALDLVQGDVAGIFTDAAGSQTSYLLEDLDFRLTQDVQGILYLSRRTVVFPTEPFAGTLWTSGYSIAGAPMGNLSSLVSVSQAVGSLSTTGDLTLNLAFNLNGGVFTASFTTH